ncbi:MAG: 2-dehydropantoate 2-reductase [bacterium]
MHIVVIGAGSLGCLLAGYLARAEHDVYLVDTQLERTKAIQQRGIVVEGVGGDFEVKARAGSTYEGAKGPDLVLVCVKTYDTDRAARCISTFIDESTDILTLQRGVGNLEQLARTLPREQLLAGTTALGANLLGPGRVHHTHSGLTHIGDTYGDRSTNAEQVAKLFSAARLPTIAADSIREIIWSKLAVSVGISALSALLRVRNGRLLANDGTMQVMKSAVNECVAVANASGVNLDSSVVSDAAREAARLTASDRSSMLKDLLDGHRTEIDALNGAVVHRGQEIGVATPVNETLTHLVRALEHQLST